MAKVWVRAKTIVRVDENGQNKTFYPGDWCQMGKQQARELLSTDQVEILRPVVLRSVQDLTDCAILTIGVLPEPHLGYLIAKFPGVPIQTYEGRYPNAGRFLLWNPAAHLKRELIFTGFQLLEKWQIAVPLYGYKAIAELIGTEEERAATKAVIHDLRTPVYDGRVMFVRNCRETRKMFDLWEGGDLGLLRAIYQARPVINALPPTWILE